MKIVLASLFLYANSVFAAPTTVKLDAAKLMHGQDPKGCVQSFNFNSTDENAIATAILAQMYGADVTTEMTNESNGNITSHFDDGYKGHFIYRIYLVKSKDLKKTNALNEVTMITRYVDTGNFEITRVPEGNSPAPACGFAPYIPVTKNR